jgi:hypothetical protein
MINRIKNTILKRIASMKQISLGGSVARPYWRENGLAFVFYALLSAALSWPLLRDFTTQILDNTLTGDGLSNLWVLWHYQQWLLGKELLFHTQLLYYPVGISLLIHGVGPVIALFALPFWPLGPVAAYNGALLISLWLTGCLAYLLARALGLKPSVALFAGVVLQSSPVVSAGLGGQPEMVFLGALPLVLLMLHHGLDADRNILWGLATALALLCVLLTNGYQFVFAVLAMGFFITAEWLTVGRAGRGPLLRRVIMILMSALVVCGPLLIRIISISNDPSYAVVSNQESIKYMPDLTGFFSSNVPSRLISQVTGEKVPISTSLVSLFWTGMLLCVIAWIGGKRPARRWFTFTVLVILFSLGPFLELFGKTRFTDYQLPIILPYAFLSSLPGLDFMRTPPRFMMIGFVGFSILSSFGLDALVDRFQRFSHWIVLFFIILILIERGPVPFKEGRLPQPPRFYQQLSQDQDQYGVFDLPNEGGYWYHYSSVYEIYQMTHRKGIARGYLSRGYGSIPIPHLGQFLGSIPDRNLLLNGKPALFADAQCGLALLGYRYVVLHKLVQEQYEALDDTPYGAGYWGARHAKEFIEGVFGNQTPYVDDSEVTAYRIGSCTAMTTLEWGQNWSLSESGSFRFARSPASLYVVSPYRQSAVLQITTPPLGPDIPTLATGCISSNDVVLDVSLNGSNLASVSISPERTVSLPVVLPQGSVTIGISVHGSDSEETQFAVESVELLTTEEQPTLLSNESLSFDLQTGLLKLCVQNVGREAVAVQASLTVDHEPISILHSGQVQSGRSLCFKVALVPVVGPGLHDIEVEISPAHGIGDRIRLRQTLAIPPLLSSQVLKSRNLVLNPGFELLDKDWGIQSIVHFDRNDVHSGSIALRIDKADFPETNYYHVSTTFPMNSSVPYVFGGWVKSFELRDGVRLIANDGSGPFWDEPQPNGVSGVAYGAGSEDWTLRVGVIPPRTQPGDGSLTLLMSNFQQGSVWLDDVFVIPLYTVEYSH